MQIDGLSAEISKSKLSVDNLSENEKTVVIIERIGVSHELDDVTVEFFCRNCDVISGVTFKNTKHGSVIAKFQ